MRFLLCMILISKLLLSSSICFINYSLLYTFDCLRAWFKQNTSRFHDLSVLDLIYILRIYTHKKNFMNWELKVFYCIGSVCECFVLGRKKRKRKQNFGRRLWYTQTYRDYIHTIDSQTRQKNFLVTLITQQNIITAARTKSLSSANYLKKKLYYHQFTCGLSSIYIVFLLVNYKKRTQQK